MPATSLFTRAVRVLILTAAITVAAQGQSTPTVDDAKRAIDQKLQKIWKGIGTKGTRTVLFQEVMPGRATPGHFPFRVTLLIHDQTEGYPKNRYYGTTCVGRLEHEVYVVSPDDFGGWDVQGRMTPDSSAKSCKDNPAEGISAIPLTSLQGTKASADSAGTAASRPPQPNVASAMSGDIAPGSYECWGNGQARPLLNFTVLGNNQYRDSEGHTGTMRVDANGRVTFRGGNLDGFLPAGFYAVYHKPQGRPTVSFRNSGGSEAQYCEKK